MIGSVRWLVPVLVVTIAVLGAAVVATADPPAHATVCHRTGSSVNPFVTIDPSVNGAYHGHLGHSGDVIPPFEYQGETYSLNWPSDDVTVEGGRCVATEPSVERPNEEEPPEVEPGDPVETEPPFTG